MGKTVFGAPVGTFIINKLILGFDIWNRWDFVRMRWTRASSLNTGIVGLGNAENTYKEWR